MFPAPVAPVWRGLFSVLFVLFAVAAVVVAVCGGGGARGDSTGPVNPELVTQIDSLVDSRCGDAAWNLQDVHPRGPATSSTIFSQCLLATGFDFSGIPADSTIQGVTVRVVRNTSSSAVFRDRRYGLVRRSTQLQPSKPENANVTMGSSVVTTYGSPTDLWNTMLDFAAVQDTGFGAYLSYSRGRPGPCCEMRILGLELDIEYTPPTTSATSATTGSTATTGAGVLTTAATATTASAAPTTGATSAAAATSNGGSASTAAATGTAGATTAAPGASGSTDGTNTASGGDEEAPSSSAPLIIGVAVGAALAAAAVVAAVLVVVARRAAADPDDATQSSSSSSSPPSADVERYPSQHAYHNVRSVETSPDRDGGSPGQYHNLPGTT